MECVSRIAQLSTSTKVFPPACTAAKMPKNTAAKLQSVFIDAILKCASDVAGARAAGYPGSFPDTAGTYRAVLSVVLSEVVHQFVQRPR